MRTDERAVFTDGRSLVVVALIAHIVLIGELRLGGCFPPLERLNATEGDAAGLPCDSDFVKNPAAGSLVGEEQF